MCLKCKHEALTLCEDASSNKGIEGNCSNYISVYIFSNINTCKMLGSTTPFYNNLLVPAIYLTQFRAEVFRQTTIQ